MNDPGSSNSDWKQAALFLPFVALLVVLPLLRFGCSCGHDFDFHILSWLEAATQFRHGNLHPQWAFTPAFNAGEPRFVFYPPLSWSIGAVLGLALPWSLTPIVYTWLTLTAAGLGCYRLLREFASPNIALLVAALYTVNPYMLFTAYERTAYAELLAAAWLPLLLYAILRPKITILGIALPIALLWVTNAPAAVIGCYGLAILAVVRLLATRLSKEQSETSSFELIRNTLLGTGLGLGLAAFYIVPAAYERRYVQIHMAMISGMSIADNFLFHHTSDPDHDAVLHTASLLAVALLTATIISLLVTILRRKLTATLTALVTLTVILAFLLIPLSAPIWRHAPELSFLQFPWRFLSLLMPVLALALALALHDIRLLRAQIVGIGLVLAATFTGIGYHTFRQGCDPEDTLAARVALYHSPLGTDPTDEYTPNTADNDALGKASPAYWLSTQPDAKPPADAVAAPLHWPLDLVSPTPQVLILNLREYPAWRITRNHRLVTERLTRADGLIALPIPAGPSHLEIAYARGPDQIAGWTISTLSLFGLAFLRRRR